MKKAFGVLHRVGVLITSVAAALSVIGALLLTWFVLPSLLGYDEVQAKSPTLVAALPLVLAWCAAIITLLLARHLWRGLLNRPRDALSLGGGMGRD